MRGLPVRCATQVGRRKDPHLPGETPVSGYRACSRLAEERTLRNFGQRRENRSLSLGGCLISRLDKQNRASILRQAQDRQAQHERDLPFPFALSLSKGKSTLSNALLRQAPGERAGVRGNLHRFSPIPRVCRSYPKVSCGRLGPYRPSLHNVPALYSCSLLFLCQPYSAVCRGATRTIAVRTKAIPCLVKEQTMSAQAIRIVPISARLQSQLFFANRRRT